MPYRCEVEGFSSVSTDGVWLYFWPRDEAQVKLWDRFVRSYRLERRYGRIGVLACWFFFKTVISGVVVVTMVIMDIRFITVIIVIMIISVFMISMAIRVITVITVIMVIRVVRVTRVIAIFMIIMIFGVIGETFVIQNE
ncbi:hypothetical protein CAPTEDRAFT_205530 [Capitella teleta]|uniref:Uncharacterized protein n=1 Tax=Capitella teleta TaxID=283909 RepID=R7VIL5_CAPTE|nr:hypothetical protein CAPTEDRAFT_205530 [Capitella teleta]|eukprot:ELU18469.1 hypothetical protein CAPTEDRAFT_205530 [Capitella teleta]